MNCNYEEKLFCGKCDHYYGIKHLNYKKGICSAPLPMWLASETREPRVVSENEDARNCAMYGETSDCCGD